jgi:hypothetical protein
MWNRQGIYRTAKPINAHRIFDVTNNYNLSSGSRLTRREIFELFFAFFLQFFESVARKETLFAFKL